MATRRSHQLNEELLDGLTIVGIFAFGWLLCLAASVVR